MNSLLIATGFPPQVGGIQIILYKISTHLPGKEIVILTPAMNGDQELDARCEFSVNRQKVSVLTAIACKTTYFISPLLTSVSLYLLPAIRLVRNNEINTVQCGHISVGLVGYLLKKFLKTPYLVYTYAQEILQDPIPKWKFMDRRLKRLVLRNADAIITISEYTKEKIIQWGIEETKVIKIPLGVDVADSTDDGETAGIIERLSLHNKKVILTVARLVERKGIDMVIKSMPMVLKKVPNVVYLVVGSGPMKRRLSELVNKLGLKDYVIFCGDVPHGTTPSYYRACDVFIMPSRALEKKGDVEGFGLVYLEANAYRKPVIGGRSGGIPDAVLDGVTGLLVDPSSVEEISEAIVKLLIDGNYARRMGENGRRRIENEMNWENTAQKVQKVLQEMVEER